MGPGKADRQGARRGQGSSSSAGLALGRSYRRTWLLVVEMNRCCREPLVETGAGGRHGGGARWTTVGADLLAQYRALEKQCTIGVEGKALNGLTAELLPEPKAAQ